MENTRLLRVVVFFAFRTFEYFIGTSYTFLKI